MAEKELRTDMNEITHELEEIKAELDVRFAGFKKMLKPAAFAVAGIIGLKIAFKLTGFFFALFRKLKLPILVVLVALFLKFRLSQPGRQCSG